MIIDYFEGGAEETQKDVAKVSCISGGKADAKHERHDSWHVGHCT
jgi:hypothetical protein